MANKQRIQRLETRKPKGRQKITVMFDAHAGGLAKFDGVKMTQAEAEKKAAELSDNVTLLHVKYAIQEAC